MHIVLAGAAPPFSIGGTDKAVVLLTTEGHIIKEGIQAGTASQVPVLFQAVGYITLRKTVLQISSFGILHDCVVSILVYEMRCVSTGLASLPSFGYRRPGLSRIRIREAFRCSPFSPIVSHSF